MWFFLTLVTKKYTLFGKKNMIDESCADYDNVPTFIFTPTSKAPAQKKNNHNMLCRIKGLCCSVCVIIVKYTIDLVTVNLWKS